MPRFARPRHVAALLLVACFSAGCTSFGDGPGPVGPAPIRSAHPVTMTLLDFEVRSARTQAAGEIGWDVSVDYTSMFQLRAENGTTVSFDGEWTRVEFDLRFGITDRLEVFAAVPILYTSSGFLDATIEGYHDLFDFNQDGRDENPRDQFAAEISKNGTVAWRLEEDRLGFGDVPVGLAFAAVREDDVAPGVLLRGAVEIPVGRESAGFGNGELDVGIGVVVEKTLGPITATLGGDWAWVGRPRSMDGTGVDLEDFGAAFAHVEVGITDALRGLVGLDYTGQSLRGLDVREGTRDQLMLSIGGALRIGERTAVRFDFTEDLIGDVSPDFTARLGISVGF